MPILQVINAVFFTFEAFYSFLPSFWIVVVLIVYEGLLGGASYVNTFYKLSKDVSRCKGCIMQLACVALLN